MCESFQKFQSAVAEVPNPNFQIPGKVSISKLAQSYAHHSLPAFCYLNLGVTWDLADWDLGIAAPNSAGARLLPSRSLVFAE